jgi:hypothetical protein
MSRKMCVKCTLQAAAHASAAPPGKHNTQYVTKSGKKTRWMGDDTSQRCATAAHVTEQNCASQRRYQL